MTRKYTMTDKRKMRDIKQTDWEKRIEIMTLKNQGWTFEQIADKQNTTLQAVSKVYNKMKDMSIEELEEMQRLAENA